MKTLRPVIASVLLAISLPAFAAIEAPPPGMEEAQLIETTATVESVDLATRYVTLKGPEGNMIAVRAGDRVENLDKVKPGDRVDVMYYRDVAVDVVANAGDAGAPERQRATSTSPGSVPGVVNRERTSVVKILVVDPYKKAIAFRDPEGHRREVSVDAPGLRHYLDELKAGDTVRVTFTDALAVSVAPR